jgi:hypothetical protein
VERYSSQDAYLYLYVTPLSKLVLFLANSITAADTIRILVATDSHVGYEERDPIRKDDSWRSFDEIMKLAKTEDVSLLHEHIIVELSNNP